jgi:hypothetical protein
MGTASHSFAPIDEDDVAAADADDPASDHIIVAGTNPDCAIARRQLFCMVDDLVTQSIMDEPVGAGDAPAFITIEPATAITPSAGATASAVSAVAGGKRRVIAHVQVPGRGLVSIQQLVSELNHLEAGASLSKDRLTRVTQNSQSFARRTHAQVNVDTVKHYTRSCIHWNLQE